MDENITLHPIGFVNSELKHRYETPRQGILAGDRISIVELKPRNNFEQAVKNLEGFDRIWVIYLFHLNDNWKPLVTPPRHTRKKVGLFATRSPHRPNKIGMSCVKLEKVEGLKIFISESDILNGSPVLDIKPYLPYSDSFPDSKTGWVKNGLESIYTVEFEDSSQEQTKWLKDEANINLVSFAKLQLEFNPADNSRKRIMELESEAKYILAYRTWRIFYSVDEKLKRVIVSKIASGYTKTELENLGEDKYQDKTLHTKFTKIFGN